MPHKLSITQLTSPVNAARNSCMTVFSLPLFVSTFFITVPQSVPLYPPRIHSLAGHFFFPSHYNAVLILNMEPTVVG